MSSLKILFFPDFDQNQYTENIYRIIESIEDVSIERVNDLPLNLVKRGFKHYDVAVVSWLENWLVDSKKKQLTLKTTIRFLSRIIVLKLVSKKLIYIRHNIYPHSFHGRTGKLAARITDFACWLAGHSIAHSGHLGAGYKYVPHPLYSFDKLSEDIQEVSSQRYVIFGRIIEYKAIDKLLSIWQHIPLIIAGSVGSQSYVDKLIQLKSKRNLENVEIDARFLSDNEAKKIVSTSLGLILSHSEDDMIVSGSFFFAASLGVPVYAVKSPFLQWLKSEFDYSGLYVFDDLAELVKNLSQKTDVEIDRKKILAEAKIMFGDAAIKQGLEKLILT